MIDIHLRADSEADLVAALPMFRGTDRDGNAVWITSGPHHALDIGFPVVTAPAVFDADGKVATPAVLDPHFHANIRLDGKHPDHVKVQNAAAPHAVTPKSPRRVFA